ncbi:MAG: 3-hydroxyacyl-CoA dehydrogenase NAD-binding domain-containing protein, partial [Dehalococcoidia bacterium]
MSAKQDTNGPAEAGVAIRVRPDLGPWASPRQTVRRATVLGSGTMGSQIAALLADQGIPCDLLDLPSDEGKNRLAEEGKRRLSTLRPPPLYSADSLGLIRVGNFSDDLARVAEADWVVEAVAENLDIKRKLWAQVAPHLRPGVIVSTNTSGIPIASIAEALPPELRSRFMGTHFFNPPRYLRLMELIPWSGSDPAVVAAMSRFTEYVLGKGVVTAHDVPNFVGNRIGTYGLMVTLRAMEEFGLGPDEVDSITGPAMGRPNSATFRTLDLVGLDVLVAVCDNMRGYLTEQRERDGFEVPQYLRDLIQRGWIGEKTRQGFFKRIVADGETQIHVLQPDSFEYRPRRSLRAPSLAAVRDIEDPGVRLRTLVGSDDVAGRFAWRILSQVLVYAAEKVGEISDDIISIDRAMQWGYGWELGPFETWDALGVTDTIERMQADGQAVPEWVKELGKEGKGFYRHQAQGSLQATPQSTYAVVPESERAIPIHRLRAANRAIVQRPGTSLYDLGDGVAFLDFHSPKQAIGPDLLEMLDEAATLVS